jgi:hypothetical protein
MSNNIAPFTVCFGCFTVALKQADNGDYELLIKLQGNLVGG